jgi:hypothetical protein
MEDEPIVYHKLKAELQTALRAEDGREAGEKIDVKKYNYRYLV